MNEIATMEITDYTMDTNADAESAYYEDLVARNAEEEAYWDRFWEEAKQAQEEQDSANYPYEWEGIETLCTGCVLFEGWMERQFDMAASHQERGY